MSTQTYTPKRTIGQASSLQARAVLETARRVKTLCDRLAAIEELIYESERKHKPMLYFGNHDRAQFAMDAVCQEFAVQPDDILDRSKTSELVDMRSHLIRLLRDRCRYSFQEIGRFLGKHHTTVIHSYEKARRDKDSIVVYERILPKYEALVAEKKAK